jgi:hypothetical protein
MVTVAMLLVTSWLCASGFLACVPGLFTGDVLDWCGNPLVLARCLRRRGGLWRLATIGVLVLQEDGVPVLRA